jgi:hypothetical protein
MLFVAGLGLAFQISAQIPLAKRADSIATVVAKRAEARVVRTDLHRPVTAEEFRTAFKDSSARELLMQARQARLSQDSALTGYDATTYQRISAGLGFTRIGRDRLVFRSERADRVRWRRGIGLWIDVKGARTVMPGIPEVAQREAGPDIARETDMTPVPYFPGYEPVWMGVEAAKPQIDSEGPIHPLAEGAEAYYTYRTGDSLALTLSGGRVIRLRELDVRPREPKWNVVVGSLWFDVASGQLVRAAYRFAVPTQIDALVLEDDPHAFDDVPKWIKPAIFPMQGQISAITIEYGMYGGRFWLPRARSLRGSGQASFMRVPFSLEQSFTYASVNGTDSLPPAPVFIPRQPPPPDSLTGPALQAWRDSARAVRRAIAAARRDSIRKGFLPPAVSQCDTNAYTASTSRNFGATKIPVASRTPCDMEALAHAPELPASIYDPGDKLFDLKARDALIAEALAMGVQAPVTLDPHHLPKPTISSGIQLLRYNRVEGLSGGIGASQVFGGGYTADVSGRIGLADREPNAELTVARSNLARSIFVSGYKRLVSAGDWGNPLSFGSSLSAALFGRDEGFYYRAAGVELGGRSEEAAVPVEWRFFLEREQSATPRTTFALLGNNASPNIGAATLTMPGASIRLRNSHGLDPNGFRIFSDLRAEAGGGDSTYGRGALDLTFTDDFGAVAGALTLSGGSSIGALPAQRKWYLGGTHTIRGQTPDTATSGSAFWMARLELGRTIQGARPVVFGDLGWAGDRTKLREVGLPMSGVGAGASLLDGLIRFDVARGLNPRRQWRVDMYLNAVF